MSISSTPTDVPTRPAAALSVPRLVVRRLGQLGCSPLLQKSGLSVFDQAVVSGTSFATSVLLGRCAPREELGIYYLALSVVFFARGIQEQVVTAPYMIYCNRRQGSELAEYTGSALLHECGVLLATTVALAAALVTGLAPAAASAAFWLLVIAAPLLLMREFVRQMLFAHLDLRAAIALDVGSSLLQLGALFALAIADRLTVSATIAVLAVSSGAAAIVWLAVKRQRTISKLRTATRDLAHNWPFARWALASQLLAATTPYVLPWVVALTHGAAETGTLGACTTLVGLSNIFLVGLCNFLTPRAARAFAAGGLVELQGVLKKTALLFSATLGLIAAFAFLLGEQVALLVYGPQFAGTGLVIGVLSLSVLANSIGVTAGNGLFAMERPSANFLADLCSLGVVVMATILCVPPLGPLGAALATLAGTASGTLVRLWTLRQTMRDHALAEATA